MRARTDRLPRQGPAPAPLTRTGAAGVQCPCGRWGSGLAGGCSGGLQQGGRGCQGLETEAWSPAPRAAAHHVSTDQRPPSNPTPTSQPTHTWRCGRRAQPPPGRGGSCTRCSPPWPGGPRVSGRSRRAAASLAHRPPGRRLLWPPPLPWACRWRGPPRPRLAAPPLLPPPCPAPQLPTPPAAPAACRPAGSLPPPRPPPALPRLPPRFPLLQPLPRLPQRPRARAAAGAHRRPPHALGAQWRCAPAAQPLQHPPRPRHLHTRGPGGKQRAVHVSDAWPARGRARGLPAPHAAAAALPSLATPAPACPAQQQRAHTQSSSRSGPPLVSAEPTLPASSASIRISSGSRASPSPSSLPAAPGGGASGAARISMRGGVRRRLRRGTREGWPVQAAAPGLLRLPASRPALLPGPAPHLASRARCPAPAARSPRQ